MIAVKFDDLLHDRRMTLTELADWIGMPLAGERYTQKSSKEKIK